MYVYKINSKQLKSRANSFKKIKPSKKRISSMKQPVVTTVDSKRLSAENKHFLQNIGFKLFNEK